MRKNVSTWLEGRLNAAAHILKDTLIYMYCLDRQEAAQLMKEEVVPVVRQLRGIEMITEGLVKEVTKYNQSR
jgi:hypothetical protein